VEKVKKKGVIKKGGGEKFSTGKVIGDTYAEQRGVRGEGENSRRHRCKRKRFLPGDKKKEKDVHRGVEVPRFAGTNTGKGGEKRGDNNSNLLRGEGSETYLSKQEKEKGKKAKRDRHHLLKKKGENVHYQQRRVPSSDMGGRNKIEDQGCFLSVLWKTPLSKNQGVEKGGFAT